VVPALATMDERAKPQTHAETAEMELRVRRIHRRDRVWRFLKLVFRDVNRETVE
jgi:hypothetical protein